MSISNRQRLINIGYSLVRIVAGLFLHPYQTMQSLVEDRQLVWLSLAPSWLLGLVTLSWRVIVLPIAQSWSSCAELNPWVCGSLNWLADWVVSLVIVWQILLLYLLFRFKWAWRRWQADKR